ncbi:MAG: DUF177 domain-containing protein [Candidatus Eremiobacteraeota bacterium]|nr:DUF177 domain-containing protein [Candidatus Eremiobacteraeota bacterium]
MKISVERLFHPDVDAIEIDSPVRFQGELAERYPAGVRVAGQITRIAHGVHLRGQVQGDERETCARCLEIFWRRADVEFDETFSEDVAAADELFSDVAPLVGRSIDLAHLVSQVLEVDEPLAAICAQNCRGICPHCGANRNLAHCACHEGVIDERLAGLAALRDELTHDERMHRRS